MLGNRVQENRFVFGVNEKQKEVILSTKKSQIKQMPRRKESV